MAELILALLLVLACAPAFLPATPHGRTVSWMAARIRRAGAWIDKMDDATGRQRSMYDSWSRLVDQDRNPRCP